MDDVAETIALAIPHTPWKPERVESLQRLLKQWAGMDGTFKLFTDKEPNWSWSEKLWHWGFDTGASHLLQLQQMTGTSVVAPVPELFRP